MTTMDISLPTLALAVSKSVSTAVSQAVTQANAYTDAAVGGDKLITLEELQALADKLDITISG